MTVLPVNRPPAIVVWPIVRRLLAEIGPVIVFAVAYVWSGMLFATSAFIAATAVAAIVSVIRTRSVPAIPMVSLLIVAVFGGLTLLQAEDAFIMVRPTVTNALFAAGLGLPLLFGRNLLRGAFGRDIRLSDRGWRVLAWRTVAYLAVLALANEAVRLLLSTDAWVAFKAFGILPSNIVFIVLQIPLIRTEWKGLAAEGAATSQPLRSAP